jgi:hypothetical protein
MPIVGDVTYGSVRDFPDGIALHARGLQIQHPADRTPLRFEAPLPETWKRFGIEETASSSPRPPLAD